jgi:tetratricopeptide (TPR) repeat protein
VNKPESLPEGDERSAPPVFVSYATADRTKALSVCKAVERRGTRCWISTRDVAPGDNYQEAIVQSLRHSRAMVLVFSEAANNSDEIKKELSLASRYRIPVLTFRIEDVEPSDAFAYELSTRQWIDAFEGWDKSIDSLNQRLQQISGSLQAGAPPATPLPQIRRSGMSGGRWRIAAAALLLLLIGSIAAWLVLRPSSAAAHSMQVRLAGYQLLSPDLPSSMPAAIDDEVDAAFNDDGIVSVSRASRAPAGNTPAYALTGTIRRDGDKIKVTSRLTNERTGATLWTDSRDYLSSQQARVPHLAGVHASMQVRMGLFGASTYPGALSDQALASYFQFWASLGHRDAAKALDSAHKLVAAVPDFSWGWSAVAIADSASANSVDSPGQAAPFRQEGLKAADKALGLDPRNSEALAYKAVLLPATALVEREALFKRALEARPLACGCEHHIYGQMLLDVGRVAAANSELRRAVAVLPLNPNTQIAYAQSFVMAGQNDQAKAPLDAATDLSADPNFKDVVQLETTPFTHDYAAGAKAASNPQVEMSAPLRAAVQAAFQALASGKPQEKAAAVKSLAALPDDDAMLTINLIALLGAPDVALRKVDEYWRQGDGDGTYLLFFPSMDTARRSPAFPALAEKSGLIRYWKTTHTRPDVCTAKEPPPFCRMI